MNTRRHLTLAGIAFAVLAPAPALVSVRADTRSLRLPSPEEFLWQYVGSTPLAEVLAQAGAERRRALERDVVEGWQGFVTNGALRLEVRMVAATARKGASS